MNYLKISYALIINLSDAGLKFIFFLTFPIFYSNNFVADFHIYLSLIFISSIFLKLAYEGLLLKKMTDFETSINEIKIYLKKIFVNLSKSYLLFILVIFFFLYFENYLNNYYFFKVLKSLYINIIISSFCYSIIFILSYGLRALNQTNLSLIFLGFNWSLPVIIILATFKFLNIEDKYLIINLFTLIYVLIAGLITTVFYIILYRFRKKKQKSHNKQKLDQSSLYIDSINGVFVNWFPILIFGFFNNQEQIALFSTQFRIGLGFFTVMNIIDYLSFKEISIFFQKKTYSKLIKSFSYYKKIKIFLSILLFFGSVFLLVLFNIYFENNYGYLFFIFLFLILSTSIFGPVNISYVIFNKEKLLAKINIIFVFKVLILFFIGTSFYNHEISLIIFGLLFFSNIYLKYKYLKLKNL